MLAHVFILLRLLAVGWSATTNDCPSGLKRNEYLQIHDGVCYQFVTNERKSFKDARNYCKNQGGQLAIVKSQSVDRYLRDAFKDTYAIYYSAIWIGLRSHMNEYHWVDGSKMSYNQLDEDSSSEFHEVCAAISPKRTKWLTFLCESSLFKPQHNRFVCQYPIKQSKAQEESNCPAMIEYENDVQELGNKCFHFQLNHSLTFRKAEEYCEEHYGTLALIKSKQVNDFLQQHMTETYNLSLSSSAGALWIGLNYSESYKEYRWLDGTAMSYNNFNKYSIVEKGCATISPRLGKWRKDFCTDYKFDSKHFICEFDKGAKPETTEITPTNYSVSTSSPSIFDNCPIKSNDYVKELDNKCYFFSLNDSLTFEKSESYCKDHGGTLTMPKSQKMNEFLHHHLHYTYDMGYSSPPLWIGLKKKKSYYPYQWIDISRLHYRNFRSKYPDGNCAAISATDGVWLTFNCTDTSAQGPGSKHFICEFDMNN